MNEAHLISQDREVFEAISAELLRERTSIELIASENLVSPAVMEAQGSLLTNKYAEGYPGKRYYGGCKAVDVVEDVAIRRAKELFGCAYANVQPHSGATANFAAYMALIRPGDTILGMDLSNGGHLTHGAKVNFSGQEYRSVSYGVNGTTEVIDYDEVERIAKAERPAMIVAGASAYPRIIDFERFADIAHSVDAYLMVDMAHIAGLVAAGLHPSPLPYADIVTSTTHKTLRGPRGGLILTNDRQVAEKVDKAVFPGTQGGPLMHVIAGKAVAFGEALTPEYRSYAKQIVANMAAMGRGMVDGGLRLVSGGTDNHLALVDLNSADITGKDAETLLERVGITVNKNTIPNEKRSPFVTSGIRVGTPAMTTRGFDADEAERIGQIISETVFHPDDDTTLARLHDEVAELLSAHPLYPELS